MTVIILAALAMFLQDLIAVPLTMAEARNKAHLSGLLDTLGWLVAITTTFLAVDTLAGHDTARKVGVIIAVSIANYLGSYMGVKVGKRFVKEDATTLSGRVARLEENTRFVDPPKGKP